MFKKKKNRLNALRKPGHRLAIDPRSKRFKRLKRRVLLCMPSDSKHWQQVYFNDTFADAGMEKDTGFVIQVGSGNRGRDSFPEYGFDPEDINAREGGAWALNAAWMNGQKPEGMFYDHEPHFVNEEGRTENWSGRSIYLPEDAEWMRVALDELAEFNLPLSQYGIPRVPKDRRSDFMDLRGYPTSIPLLDGCSWVQLNYYPHPRYVGTNEAGITPEAEAGIRASVRQHVRLYRLIFPGKQIVPAVFARFGNVANAAFFSILLDEFDKCDDIKSILYWTNPHSDRTFGNTEDTSIMTRVYTAKFHEVSRYLQKWLLGG